MIRSAKASDIEDIQKLIRENPETIIPRNTQELEELIETTWVAENENAEIIGCCCLEVYSKKICEVRTLVVKKNIRKNGIGSQLVQMAVDEANRRKIPQILAITSVPEFFERLNFGPDLQEKFAVFWHGNKVQDNRD